MRRKEAAMPPILPAADEEARDAQLPALRCEREHIGVAEAIGVDRLAALDEGQRLQPVTDHRRLLIIHRFGGARHRITQPFLHSGRAAFEKILRVAHQRSEEHTSELQSLMHISYAVFCFKKK